MLWRLPRYTRESVLEFNESVYSCPVKEVLYLPRITLCIQCAQFCQK